MSRQVAVALSIAAYVLGAGCGRIGFAEVPTDAVTPQDGVIEGDWVVGSSTCASGPTSFALARDISAGETLIVGFFMREPQSGSTAIEGGPAWSTDVSFSTIETVNRRHLSMFRATSASTIAAGTIISIDHPLAGASGSVALAMPGDVAPVPAEQPTLAEGHEPPFSAQLMTSASAALCFVVHHNAASASFDGDWARLTSARAECGGARESVTLHVAARTASNPTECTGTISNTVTWAIALVGYDNLVPP
jgi:hypothetical protein